MSEVCTDGRFEIIAAYKKKLIESTNIETSSDEMKVIDKVLFRFWQMGWLPPVPHGRLIDADELKKKHHWTDDFYETEYVEVEDIDAAPTVIEAEEDR